MTLDEKQNNEFMIVGNPKFKIEVGDIVQIKSDDAWNNKVCTIVYIIDGVASLFSPAMQQYGLYKLGIWNAENVIPYNK